MTSRSSLLTMTALTALLAGSAVAQPAAPATPANPPGTAVGRAVEGATSGVPSSATPPSPPASTATPSTPSTGSVAQPSTLGTSPSARSAPATTPGTPGTAPTAALDHQRASKIVGTSVYNDRNESIGSVDDIVLGTGVAPTVVVSVGGFLGIGAKLVSVPFEQLRWSEGESRWVIAGATRDSLTSLPTFEYGSSRG